MATTTLLCAQCNARVPVHDDHNAWCPRCGADIASPPSSEQDPPPPPPGSAAATPLWAAPRPGFFLPDTSSSPADAPRPRAPSRVRSSLAAAAQAPADDEPQSAFTRTCPACACVFSSTDPLLFRMACPGCGASSSAADAARRAATHAWIAGGALFVLLVIGLLGAGGGVPLESAAVAGAVLLGLAGLAHVGLLFFDPFAASSESDRQRSQLALANGRVTVVQPGNPAASGSPAEQLSMASVACVVALMLAPAACLGAYFYRDNADEGALATNAGVTPSVVAVGDEIKIDIPTSVESISGIWRADVKAELLNRAQLGLSGVEAHLDATTDNHNWGDKLVVGKGASDRPIRNFWVKVRVPAVASLEGKTLRIGLDLDVKYPVIGGFSITTLRKSFIDRKTRVSHVVSVRLSSTSASRDYRAIYGLGMGAAGVLLAVGGGGLAVSSLPSRRKAAGPSS